MKNNYSCIPFVPVVKMTEIRNRYEVIGLMSGTSLDGLDLAFCRFYKKRGTWDFKIIHAETIAYAEVWKKRLNIMHEATAAEISDADAELGIYFGRQVQRFMNKYKCQPQLIASHGHTVLHQPQRGFTVQIGNGAHIAARTGIDTVCNFRIQDVALGGQGAPLVPAGDRLLFPGFDFCLNLGGISNISFEKSRKRVAFDICPVNMALNFLSGKKGLACDRDGTIARSGKVDTDLLRRLNSLSWYRLLYPKSMGREWFEKYFLPVVEHSPESLNNKMCTVAEHAAIQISSVINAHMPKGSPKKSVLVTGGGAFNKYLVQRIQSLSKATLVIPDPMLIKFKEALVFAFLGVLRVRNEINVWKSVTGARTDHSAGVLFQAVKK